MKGETEEMNKEKLFYQKFGRLIGPVLDRTTNPYERKVLTKRSEVLSKALALRKVFLSDFAYIMGATFYNNGDRIRIIMNRQEELMEVLGKVKRQQPASNDLILIDNGKQYIFCSANSAFPEYLDDVYIIKK